MRIAFSGVQCTGKTTLLNEMEKSDFGNKFVFVRESVRKLHKQGTKINEDGDDNTQLRVMLSHINNLQYNFAVLDRCLLDGMVYTEWAFKHGKITEDTYKLCKDTFYNYIDNYDIIFYLVPEFDLIEDGVRSLNTKFRDETKEIFDDYVNLISVKGVRVVRLHGTVEERLHEIQYQMTCQ